MHIITYIAVILIVSFCLLSYLYLFLYILFIKFNDYIYISTYTHLADKMAAIKALEIRSIEFLKEKEEKKKLEERIIMLTSQMIHGSNSHNSPRPGDPNHLNSGGTGGMVVGGTAAEEAQEVLEMMKEHQEKVRNEYESKLASLEKER